MVAFFLTDLTDPVSFYLRGEEYSAQLDHFIQAVQGKVPNILNNFDSAWHTDQAIKLIKNAQH